MNIYFEDCNFMIARIFRSSARAADRGRRTHAHLLPNLGQIWTNEAPFANRSIILCKRIHLIRCAINASRLLSLEFNESWLLPVSSSVVQRAEEAISPLFVSTNIRHMAHCRPQPSLYVIRLWSIHINSYLCSTLGIIVVMHCLHRLCATFSP